MGFKPQTYEKKRPIRQVMNAFLCCVLLFDKDMEVLPTLFSTKSQNTGKVTTNIGECELINETQRIHKKRL